MKNNLDPQNINTEDSPAPFHLMKILDEYILFDVSSNRFYKISKIMFHYLLYASNMASKKPARFFKSISSLAARI